MPNRTIVEEVKFEIQTQLGPLNIKLTSQRKVVSDLTLDLVRGEPTPSPADEPRIECEILFEKQLITFTQSRAEVSAYILDLLRGYPTIAEGVTSRTAASGKQ